MFPVCYCCNTISEVLLMFPVCYTVLLVDQVIAAALQWSNFVSFERDIMDRCLCGGGCEIEAVLRLVLISQLLLAAATAASRHAAARWAGPHPGERVVRAPRCGPPPRRWGRRSAAACARCARGPAARLLHGMQLRGLLDALGARTSAALTRAALPLPRRRRRTWLRRGRGAQGRLRASVAAGRGAVGGHIPRRDSDGVCAVGVAAAAEHGAANESPPGMSRARRAPAAAPYRQRCGGARRRRAGALSRASAHPPVSVATHNFQAQCV